MATSKTGGSLKGIFEPSKAQAAQAVMESRPVSSSPAARNRKSGGRGVRISGYLPVEISEALRDEVIRRTVAERRSVSINDVLCSILSDWHESQKAAP
jgi:transcriptional regulator of met regulon